jgi:hypothetical protein
MRKALIILALGLIFTGFSVRAVETREAEFELYAPGVEGIVDYEKYGEFQDVGTANYNYRIRDKRGLEEAVGIGIFPNTRSVYEDPLYREKRDKKLLEGNHWHFVNIDDQTLSFYKWATAPEAPGVKQYYTALALEKAGFYNQAIKGYYAILVHFPKAVGWTSFDTPWYVGKVAKKRIQYLTRKHPELNIKLVDARIEIENSFDTDITNDKYISINPGRLVSGSARVEKEVNLEKLNIINRGGSGKVQLVQYENGHWQLRVNNKPFMIQAISYLPVKVGQSPDEGTQENWMLQDTNKSGLIDSPYEAWVDKNRNKRQDEDEPTVGDFQLMKEMGVNTIRLYHHASNKELLRDLYENYGIMTMVGDFVGMYTVGSGATWEEGTDYTNPEQRENMLESVKEMIYEFKDEPYILMWVLGNENNYGGVHGHVGGAGNAAEYPREYYSFVNSLAKWIKENDPHQRPVAICNGDALFLDILAEECPEVDIFGANSYQGNHGFSFWEDVEVLYNKPVVITEYGCPAYHGRKSREEAERDQADYHWGVWTDILANSAGFGGTGNSLGGVVFEWLDGWWKSGQPPIFSPYVHEPVGQWQGPFPDGWAYEEWFAICSQGDGSDSPFMRQLRESYYLYQQLWIGEKDVTYGKWRTNPIAKTNNPSRNIGEINPPQPRGEAGPLKTDFVYAAGRIAAADRGIYVYQGERWEETFALPSAHEIYALTKDSQGNLWAAGNYFGNGKVWKYDGRTWNEGEALEGALVLYDLYQDSQGNLWAGGAGGSKVWKYDGESWNEFATVDEAAGIYALCEDAQGNLWAGGFPLNVANVWKYDGNRWIDAGQPLGSSDIYSMIKDSQGNLWAGGTSKTDRKIWQYDYERRNWSRGFDLPDCEALYALYQDSQGNLWAAGAGGSKVWKYDGESWNEVVGVKDCIAIYSLAEDREGNIYAGGWSQAREASIWKHSELSGWTKEEGIEGFVIRAMESRP